MSSRPDCNEVRELAPELALGIASGEDRARALDHLSSCPQCGSIVQEMSDVSDELLLAAPAHEPPVGFESRMIDRYRAGLRKKPRLALILAAAALLLGVGAGGTYLAVRPDVRFAHHYQSVFAAAQGEYFASSPLYSGERAMGQAFAYQGSPSWVFVVLDGASPGDQYAVKLVTRNGHEIELGSFTATPGTTSWGRALPVDLRSVSTLRLIPDNGITLEAEFHR
ncbi:MAG: zf-HC2 domain-containing protein, partial [Actinomycetota bacterium]|nr:zf-HC2 domain-containing protein [Actinomycetota bacterium]